MSGAVHTPTPGPWAITETAKSHAPSDAWFELTAMEGHLVLAEVYTDDDGADDRGVTVETARANARLIASAPELLEALASIVAEADRGIKECPVNNPALSTGSRNACTKCGHGPDKSCPSIDAANWRAIEIARAAIARAKGENQ